MSTQIDSNEHFATMRRTPRETFAFAVFAVIATVATTLLAVAPAGAAGPNHGRTPAATQAADR